MKTLNYRFALLIILLVALVNCEKQFPVEKPDHITRVGIIGCHRQNLPSPALQKYIDSKVEMILWVGDNVYADTRDNPDFIRSCYSALAAKDEFETLRKLVPFMATWDDHDYGLNNAGKEYALKAESKDIFRKFWRLQEQIPADRDGVYNARIFTKNGKKLQVIMLDVRYNRDTPGDKSDMLGANQWQWLQQELAKPADVRLIVSGTQILLDRESGSETWQQYPQAVDQLFATVRRSGVNNVIFISGDQHYAEVSRKEGAIGYDVVEFSFAGLNQIEEPEFHSHRVSPVCKSLNSYSYIDIQWEDTRREKANLTYKVFNADTDQAEVLYRVNLDELRMRLDFTPRTLFLQTHQVHLNGYYPELELRYTLDGTDPQSGSTLYREPINITATTTVSARYFNTSGEVESPVFRQQYVKVIPHPSVAVQNPKPGLKYNYYEGEYLVLPDFTSETVVKTGTTQSLQPEGIANREDHYAIRFEGYINVAREGLYSFFTYSDDGSKLYLHDTLVVDNDGSHSKRIRTGLVALAAGWHPLKLDYFEDYSGQTLQIGYRLASESANLFQTDQLAHE
jgi:hypothetical protein